MAKKLTTSTPSYPAPADAQYPWIAEQLRSLAVPIETLLPDPANAKTHGPLNIDGIAASLRVYGQQKPVVVRKETMTVVAGNGTPIAAVAERQRRCAQHGWPRTEMGIELDGQIVRNYPTPRLSLPLTAAAR